jgi:hypothetical protein
VTLQQRRALFLDHGALLPVAVRLLNDYFSDATAALLLPCLPCVTRWYFSDVEVLAAR